MGHSGRIQNAGKRVTWLRNNKTTLAQRIAAQRASYFVGREQELAAFQTFVAPESAYVVWFIIGAGGVGKTALLQYLHDAAKRMALDCVYVDARQVPPNPVAVQAALARACHHDSFQAFCAARQQPLLLIDTFEHWQVLEPWLREQFLPSLPDSLQVVICSRTEPSLEWRSDAGWQGLLLLTHLGGLEPQDCGEYLDRRGLDTQAQQQLLAFSRGYPLALAMGADSLAAGYDVGADSAVKDDSLIQTLLESFTSEARDNAQRQALDACAVARALNESQLAAMLGSNDVSALYAWLGGLAFVEAGETGIFPHDLVREVLMQQMSKHTPGRYEAFAQAAFDWTVDRIEAAQSLSWDEAARLATDGMYLLRALPVVQHFMSPTGTRALYLDGARTQDYAALVDMVARHEGPQSLAWFEFWYARYPESVRVIRDVHETPRGFFMMLDMEALEPEARDSDPLTRRLWRALCDDLALRPGEHAPFVRFWCSAEHGQSQSPVKTQILMAISTYNLMTKNLRLTAQVFGDSPDWVQQAGALGITLLPGEDIHIGERAWRIYYNEWQREPPTRYYRRFAHRCIGFSSTIAGKAAPAQPYAVLDETPFKEAVASALKHLHHPAALVANPLLASALVVENTNRGADEQARMRVLGQQINAAVEGLAEAGVCGPQWQRILHRTYLAPAPSQKQAAAALNMGYSTFRRQLAVARVALVEALWQREKAAR